MIPVSQRCRPAGFRPNIAILLCTFTHPNNGRPKGVILTHDNLAANVESCQKADKFDHNDAFLCLLPFFHTYAITGTFLLPLFSGAKMVLVDRFQPMKVMSLIQDQKISVLLAIPSMYRLWRRPRGIQGILLDSRSPGANRFRSLLPKPLRGGLAFRSSKGNGQTEAAPVVTLNVPAARKLGTIGRALPGIDLAIWDEHNRFLPAGEVGEIMVRGRNVMQGYHHLPEETAKTITDGWLHTGDLGKLDEQGFVTITGRKKDLIISAGENIYPAKSRKFWRSIRR